MQKSLGGDSKKHRRKRKDQAGGAPANAPAPVNAPVHKSDSSSSGSDSSDSSSSSSGSDSESDHEGPAGGPTGAVSGKHLKTPASAPAMANNMANSNAASVLKVRNDLMPQTAAAAGGIPVNNANPHFGNGVGGPAPVAGKVLYPALNSRIFIPLDFLSITFLFSSTRSII